MTVATRPQPHTVEVPEDASPEMAVQLEGIQQNFEVLFGDSLLLGEETEAISDSTVGTADIDDDAVTFAKMQNITSDRLLGRDTASSGNVEEISVGGGLEFTGSAGIQRSALTGDVTASAGSGATTIANDAVTFAKMQDIATDKLLGRDTAASGNVEEIGVANSIVFSGSAAIQLSGDEASPGNQEYYGTNTGGTKGWYPLTTAPSVEWTTIVTKASDQDVTNSSTLTDDSELQLSVTAGQLWHISLLIMYSGTNVSAQDYKFAFTVAAGTMIGAYRYFGLATGGGAVGTTIAANGVATTTASAIGTEASHAVRIVVIELDIRVTNTTTLKYQFAQNAAGVGTDARTKAGSLLRAKLLA